MTDRPRTVLGWVLGSDEAALRFVHRIGLLSLMTWCVRKLNDRLSRGKRS